MMRFVQYLLTTLLAFIVLSSCLLTVTGFLGYGHWLFDLSSHFHVQYLAIQTAALLILLWKSPPTPLQGGIHRRLVCMLRYPRRTKLASACCLLVFIGLNLSYIIPYYLPPQQPSSSLRATGKAKRATTPLKILHMNLFAWNTHHQLVERQIRKYHPDILSFAEYNRWWHQILSAGDTLRQYPYRMILLNGEIAFYSRIPPDKLWKDYAPENQEEPIIVAQMQWRHVPFTLLIAHPFSPGYRYFWLRNRQHFQRIIRLGQQNPRHLVVLGDLNSTLWSQGLQKLMQSLHLRDAQQGFGYQPTWPTYFPLLFIPIDHCLVTPDIAVLKSRTGGYTGSDHLPLYIEILPQ